MDREFERMRARLASNVQRLRSEKAWTQESLAFEAEVDRTYVSQIERGLKNPSLLILHKMARALDSTVVELLT